MSTDFFSKAHNTNIYSSNGMHQRGLFHQYNPQEAFWARFIRVIKNVIHSERPFTIYNQYLNRGKSKKINQTNHTNQWVLTQCNQILALYLILDNICRLLSEVSRPSPPVSRFSILALAVSSLSQVSISDIVKSQTQTDSTFIYQFCS